MQGSASSLCQDYDNLKGLVCGGHVPFAHVTPVHSCPRDVALQHECTKPLQGVLSSGSGVSCSHCFRHRGEVLTVFKCGLGAFEM